VGFVINSCLILLISVRRLMLEKILRTKFSEQKFSFIKPNMKYVCIVYLFPLRFQIRFSTNLVKVSLINW
jgi:hypothetical protein